VTAAELPRLTGPLDLTGGPACPPLPPEGDGPLLAAEARLATRDDAPRAALFASWRLPAAAAARYAPPSSALHLVAVNRVTGRVLQGAVRDPEAPPARVHPDAEPAPFLAYAEGALTCDLHELLGLPADGLPWRLVVWLGEAVGAVLDLVAPGAPAAEPALLDSAPLAVEAAAGAPPEALAVTPAPAPPGERSTPWDTVLRGVGVAPPLEPGPRWLTLLALETTGRRVHAAGALLPADLPAGAGFTFALPAASLLPSNPAPEAHLVLALVGDAASAPVRLEPLEVDAP